MAPATLSSRVSTALIWLGRAGAIASLSLLLLFVIGSIQSGDAVPTAKEAIGIAFFPIGVAVGMLFGWRWPLLGACISLISLAGFYVWSYVVAGRINNGPYFLLFTLPAVFYLIGALTQPRPRETRQIHSV